MADDATKHPETSGDGAAEAGQGVPILPDVPFLDHREDRDPSGPDTDASGVAAASGETAEGHTSDETEDATPASPARTERNGGPESPEDTPDSRPVAAPADSAAPAIDESESVPVSDSGSDPVSDSDSVRLNAYEVPVSTVPPSILQGPTISVPVPPSDTTPVIAGGEVVHAGGGSAATPVVAGADAGWQPAGSREPSRDVGSGAADAGTRDHHASDGRAGERSARRDREAGPEPASALTADRLLTGLDRPPVAGWRRWLYTATFGRVNVGDSDAVRVQRAFEHRISVRLGDRTRYVPVLSRKGGVGKTTVTTLLGMALADTREDRIIAMDANPDRGTLSDRSPGRAEFTARQLVQNRYSIDSFAQLAAYVTRDGSRLHVLASDTDPAVAQAFDDSDYRAVTDVLSRYYSVVLTDSGTGMVHSVMKGTLEKADAVVLVSGGSVDEARLASETLSWLEAHGRHDLLARAIVVINLSSGNGTQVDVSQIEQHFRSRVDTVVRIPYDRHLAEGSRVDLAKLNPATRRAVTELAALVVDQLAS